LTIIKINSPTEALGDALIRTKSQPSQYSRIALL
jgi:hypothetical protein